MNINKNYEITETVKRSLDGEGYDSTRVERAIRSYLGAKFDGVKADYTLKVKLGKLAKSAKKPQQATFAETEKRKVKEVASMPAIFLAWDTHVREAEERGIQSAKVSIPPDLEAWCKAKFSVVSLEVAETTGSF